MFENDAVTYEVSVVGMAPLLFSRFRYKVDGSRVTGDDLEELVYRNEDGHLCFPGVLIRASMKSAARRLKDPTSPRKNARLFVAESTLVLPEFIPLLMNGEPATWEEFVTKATVACASLEIKRPMVREGWTASFKIAALKSVEPDWLNNLIKRTGAFEGIGDWHPDYGTFKIEKFGIAV